MLCAVWEEARHRLSLFFPGCAEQGLLTIGQTTINRSEVSWEIRLKIAKKCWLYLNIFSCVKMNVFLSFFAFRLEMHVRCDNQYKIGADRENILGQPMLFECMGICVLSPAHESEMRGYLVYVLIVKHLSHWFCLNLATVHSGGSFCNIFRGVSRPYHL